MSDDEYTETADRAYQEWRDDPKTKEEEREKHSLAAGEWRVPICAYCGKRWPCPGSRA